MKRKLIFFVMLIAFAGLATLQSCYKDGTILAIHNTFTDPALVAPVNASTLHITGTTVDLKWTSTNADGDPVKADVYFSNSSDPDLYKANHNALTLTVPVVLGQTYHWYVVMKDKNGIPTTSATWSFTVFEPIGIFVGAYTVDEPAEGWTYPVHFTKFSDNVLKIDKYWASWPGYFTLDFTANTYSMPLTDFGGGYWGIESGTINQTTGKLTGTYTIYNPTITTVNETGTHTYTKN
jgi:hypothetical protein